MTSVTALGLVFVGGGVGASARYALVVVAEDLLGSAFPYGVFVANVVGSLAMGLAAGWLMARGGGLGPFLDLEGHDATKLALTTGLLGGFTTFSAFSLDAVRLWQSGTHGLAVAYVGLSVVLALTALVLGLWLAKGIWA